MVLPEVSSKLIIFTRFPEPGSTKTRLIPVMGPEAAADLQRSMTEHILRTADLLDLPGPCRQVRFEGGSCESMEAWLGDGLEYVRQGEGDLGERMARAFSDAFSGSADRAVIIGTDSPSITPQLLRLALFRLLKCDLVLGPAEDGGYYLVGLERKTCHRALPQVMEDISWGTGDVFSQTMEKARMLGLKTAVLPVLGDVDRPEDVHLWHEASSSAREPFVSVIVPTLNEGGNLPSLAESIATEQNVELVVCDGKSADETFETALALASRVVSADRGRWSQMNVGARAAAGRFLLFLHADTRLPRGFADRVRDAMSDPAAAAGAFRFATDLGTPPMRFVEWAANMRSRCFGIIFSDQAQFVRADLFHDLGGFPAQPIMEDYELVRRLRKRGKVVLLKETAVTSSRKYRQTGVLKLTFVHQVITWGYLLGVSPEKLAEWYRSRTLED